MRGILTLNMRKRVCVFVTKVFECLQIYTVYLGNICFHLEKGANSRKSAMRLNTGFYYYHHYVMSLQQRHLKQFCHTRGTFQNCEIRACQSPGSDRN